MSLPKHLRPRWRYLAVRIQTQPDEDISRASFKDALEAASRSLFGDRGLATQSLRLLRFDFSQGRGRAVVRVRREAVSEARAAIATIRQIGDSSIGIHVRGVSGTVRGCEENYLGHEPEELPENTVVFEGVERPATVRGSDVDIRVDNAFIGATRLDIE